MKKLTTKETCIWTILAAMMLAAVFYAVERLFVQGDFAWEFSQPVFWSMIKELAVLFLLFFLIGRFVKNKRLKLAGIAATAAVFLWIHVILIPLLVSGVYLLYICMAGRSIRRLLRGRKQAGREDPSVLRQYKKEAASFSAAAPALAWGRDFLTGALAVICLFCLMSAAGIGSIPVLCAAVLVSAGAMLVRELVCLRRPVPGNGRRAARSEEAPGADGAWSAAFSLGAAFILTMFCLQAGRMNVAVDYDSIWYGVRSAYILDNGRGIYENLGTVGVVYTYSKGWETLTLPLVLLPSYSFQISFNLWLTEGALLAAFCVAGYFLNPQMAAYLAVFLASVPGVTNMGITAKTDTITLFLQLIMIRELLVCLTGGRLSCGGPGRERAANEAPDGADGAIYYSAAALAFSWMCKPTSMVFSTAVYGMGFLGLIWMRRFSLRCGRAGRPEAAGIVVLALGGLIGIWARTWLLTGLPVTSVFSSFLIKLGFQMKYPYSAHSLAGEMGGLGGWEVLKHIADRLYGMILDPSELSHVLIAWGSLIFWFALLAAAAWCLLKKRRETVPERRLGRWFCIVYFPFLIVNLIGLFSLFQVDGNYFMLLYVLTGIFSFRLIARLSGRAVRRAYAALVLPAILFSAMLTAVSDWGWSAGLSPVNVINRGYYDHVELRHAEMVRQGKGRIWDVLAEDPRNRLIAFGSHPEDLQFPCSAQSVTDIAGSNGNLWLMMDKMSFAEFMKYAKTDYIYLNGPWIGERTWIWPLLYDMIESGYVKPILYEGENMLAEVYPDGQMTEETKKLAEEFWAWQKLWPWPAE